MAYETILYEKKDAVAKLILNRPTTYNAINPQLAGELYEALTECEYDQDVRAVILTGVGKAFCAGGDVPLFVENLPNESTFLKRLTTSFHLAINQIVRMSKPVIGAVNGVTAGGGMGLALAPDLAIASESARFTMAYTGIGATPDGGCTYYLPRLIGQRRALELAMLNRVLTASEAVNWGLINKCVPDDQLMTEAESLAQRLAQGPTLAFGRIKRLVQQSLGNTLEAQMEEESRAMAASGASEDFAEGVKAFTEKRKADFKGW